MLTWGAFVAARSDLAAAGRELLYQFGIGLAFLGTVRPDGAPRVHPICPMILGEALYAFIEPGPKRRDLIRDGRYALHSYPRPDDEDAFYVTGRAEHRTDTALRSAVEAEFWKERGNDSPPAESARQELFEFYIESCLLTRTTGHGDWNPRHTIWKAPA